MCYAIELAAARQEALAALLDIVRTTDDPTEKRRAATAILRIPDPKPCHDSAVPPQSRADPASVRPPPGAPPPPPVSIPLAAPTENLDDLLQEAEDFLNSIGIPTPPTPPHLKPTPASLLLNLAGAANTHPP